MSASQWPTVEGNLFTTNLYTIDDQGKWVVHGERKPLHRPEEWLSSGKTKLLLTAIDERIHILSQATIARNTDADSECRAHIDNLRSLRDHVLRKIEVYYQESTSSMLTGWLWMLISTCVYALAKAKFQTRLAQLKEIAPAEFPLASLTGAKTNALAVEDVQNKAPPPAAAAGESVEQPNTWTNYQAEILNKRAAENFLSKSDAPNIIWHDESDSTYYFSHKKANSALVHARVFGFYLNPYQESICKVNYKLKNKHLNAKDVKALREQIVHFIESTI